MTTMSLLDLHFLSASQVKLTEERREDRNKYSLVFILSDIHRSVLQGVSAHCDIAIRLKGENAMQFTMMDYMA